MNRADAVITGQVDPALLNLAVRIVGELRIEKHYGRLRELATCEDEDVRIAAIAQLGLVGDGSSVEVVRSSLDSTNPRIRAAAKAALTRLEAKGGE